MTPPSIPTPPPFRRAARIARIELSEIVQLTERAARLRAEGQDVIALSTGEPDFPTPAHVIEAAHQAALAGQTRYPATLGTPALRDRIAAQAGVERGNVIVSTGAKQVIANAMLASLDPGDEVVMPAPYWTSYSDIVAMAEGVPVVLDCPAGSGFRLSPEQLAAALTPKTRWLMLNAPANPTGCLYSAAELRALADVLVAHPQVMILMDEIYDLLAYGPVATLREVAPELAGRMLVVNGVSKAYAMTGWRIGWGIGPAGMIAALGAVQGQVTSGACSIAQAAALAALSGPQELLAERREILRARRDLVVEGLNALPGITCPSPDGAFYVFPNIEGAMARLRLESCAAFCAELLEQEGLALVPGRAFGLPGHLRLSFAYGTADLEAGLARLARFVTAGMATAQDGDRA